MVDRDGRAILDAANRPGLFGPGLAMLRQDPASGGGGQGPAQGGDDEFSTLPGVR